jgi:hypothetical protein
LFLQEQIKDIIIIGGSKVKIASAVPTLYDLVAPAPPPPPPAATAVITIRELPDILESGIVVGRCWSQDPHHFFTQGDDRLETCLAVVEKRPESETAV